DAYPFDQNARAIVSVPTPARVYITTGRRRRCSTSARKKTAATGAFDTRTATENPASAPATPAAAGSPGLTTISASAPTTRAVESGSEYATWPESLSHVP